MKQQTTHYTQGISWFLAFLGGILLVLMMNCSSVIAQHTTPFFSSWIIHGVGAVVALILVLLCKKTFKPYKSSRELPETISSTHRLSAPFWSYFGGIFGALTVVLAVISINSPLKLSSTFALMLVGQVIFGVICDLFGLFGAIKKRFVWNDFWMVLSVLTGSGIIILFRS